MTLSAAAKTMLAAAILGASFTGAAFARDEVFTVRLAAPAEQSRVIAQNTVWSCEADTCVASPTHAATVRACRQFVRESGQRVVAYGPESAPLSADDLARCNGVQPGTQQANAN